MNADGDVFYCNLRNSNSTSSQICSKIFYFAQVIVLFFIHLALLSYFIFSVKQNSKKKYFLKMYLQPPYYFSFQACVENCIKGKFYFGLLKKQGLRDDAVCWFCCVASCLVSYARQLVNLLASFRQMWLKDKDPKTCQIPTCFTRVRSQVEEGDMA